LVLWFVGCALVLVWVAFRDPAVDHRVLIAGAVLPDLVDAPLGGARYAHTLLAGAGLLVVVMLATRGHRHARRRWLFLPIGVLVHLAVDDVWERSELLLWPFLGPFPFGPLPSLEQSAVLIVLKELAGLVAIVWFVWRFGLAEAAPRAAFLRTGRLPRDRVG
jgi:membrane-bound metal-dependent hydrolase YbcI (DUF457 family)